MIAPGGSRAGAQAARVDPRGPHGRLLVRGALVGSGGGRALSADPLVPLRDRRSVPRLCRRSISLQSLLPSRVDVDAGELEILVN